ncbi:MAG TPA: hypothetical protein VJR89_43860 [Polyangiales bacterium]|nr:hypothetical protein [Polyangiales bacterium]
MIPLIELLAGEGARPIVEFDASAFSGGGWMSESAAWLQHASVWRGGPNDGVSWAVSFRADLLGLGVDPSKPFRIALAVNAQGAASDLTTPAGVGMLTNMPSVWALARPSSACVGRVVLEP